jgi:uncharacterized BrkB/YihY/UPF0761 family membrane protein
LVVTPQRMYWHPDRQVWEPQQRWTASRKMSFLGHRFIDLFGSIAVLLVITLFAIAGNISSDYGSGTAAYHRHWHKFATGGGLAITLVVVFLVSVAFMLLRDLRRKRRSRRQAVQGLEACDVYTCVRCQQQWSVPVAPR